MKKFTQEIVTALQQVQNELVKAEFTHPGSTEQVSIIKLIRPSYSKRVQIPNLLKTLVKSLYEYGFIGGIMINAENNHVIDGWHRLEIWQQMGHESIPCFILQINPEHERKLHLLLNRHISQFNNSDLGFTTEFATLDLVKDYGFSRADLLEADHEEVSSSKQAVTKELTRLITALPKTYHRKLDSLKKQMPARNKSEVLINLIDFYERTSC